MKNFRSSTVKDNYFLKFGVLPSIVWSWLFCESSWLSSSTLVRPSLSFIYYCPCSAQLDSTFRSYSFGWGPVLEGNCYLQIHYFVDLLVSHPLDTKLLILWIHPQRHGHHLLSLRDLWAYLVPSLVAYVVMGFWFFYLVILSVLCRNTEKSKSYITVASIFLECPSTLRLPILNHKLILATEQDSCHH